MENQTFWSLTLCIFPVIFNLINSPFSSKDTLDGKCVTRPNKTFICYFTSIEHNFFFFLTIAKDKRLQKVAKQDYEYMKLQQHISNEVKIVPLLKVPEILTPPVRWQLNGNAEKSSFTALTICCQIPSDTSFLKALPLLFLQYGSDYFSVGSLMPCHLQNPHFLQIQNFSLLINYPPNCLLFTILLICSVAKSIKLLG